MIAFSEGMIEGWENLSADFCNRPYKVVTDLSYQPQSIDMFAAILLCGRLADHVGPCEALPPIEDVIGEDFFSD